MSQSAEEFLEAMFPGLRTSHLRVTSEWDSSYNCIAWAADEMAAHVGVYWWPHPFPTSDVYWPPGVPPLEKLDAFKQAFATLGYEECDSDAYEEGFQKVALFAREHEIPEHAARQLFNGLWTSKIGDEEDIEHDLHGLEGETYGEVVCILRRPIA